MYFKQHRQLEPDLVSIDGKPYQTRTVNVAELLGAFLANIGA